MWLLKVSGIMYFQHDRVAGNICFVGKVTSAERNLFHVRFGATALIGFLFIFSKNFRRGKRRDFISN